MIDIKLTNDNIDTIKYGSSIIKTVGNTKYIVLVDEEEQIACSVPNKDGYHIVPIRVGELEDIQEGVSFDDWFVCGNKVSVSLEDSSINENKNELVDDITLNNLKDMDMPKLKSYFIRSEKAKMKRIKKETLYITAQSLGLRSWYNLDEIVEVKVNHIVSGASVGYKRQVKEVFVYKGTLREVLKQYFKQSKQWNYCNDDNVEFVSDYMRKIYKDYFYGDKGLKNYIANGGRMD